MQLSDIAQHLFSGMLNSLFDTIDTPFGIVQQLYDTHFNNPAVGLDRLHIRLAIAGIIEIND